MKVLKEFEIVRDGNSCFEFVNGKRNYCPHLDGTKWCHLFKDLDDRYERHQLCLKEDERKLRNEKILRGISGMGHKYNQREDYIMGMVFLKTMSPEKDNKGK